MIFSATIDYFHGLIIERFRGRWGAKAAVASSLILNLGLLAVFKYSGFFVENINRLAGLSLPVPSFALPIGISFYTFQTISYVIDVYRDEVEAQHSYFKFLLFVSMFHQLVAGPIVRYGHIAQEIDHRKTDLMDISSGVTRLCIGLAKKVLIANVAGDLLRSYMDAELSSLSVAGAWFGAVLYSLQIYFDFSGYSDMAIGMGRIFGFHYHENFNYPYTATSATDFWRRWHMSLGSFFRDYLYIPMGGNRRHQYLNLAVVWFLTGFWHGASWNFILWGLYFGLLIVLEKWFLLRVLQRLPRLISHLYLLLAAVVGWVIFYFTDLGRMGGYLKVMFGLSGNRLFDLPLEIALSNNIFWLLTALLFCLPVVPAVKRWVENRCTGWALTGLYSAQTVMNLSLILLCTAQLVGQSYNPFLYFRF